MKTTKEILLGLGLAIALSIVLEVISEILLDPHLLGNYADLLYFLFAVSISVILALKLSKITATVFAISAFLLFGPILLGIVSAIGCSIGQCPIF
jgi:uncharacterized membrane protein YdjX (TVP38/TMEM64 family)